MAYIYGKKEPLYKIPVRCKIWSFGLLIWFLTCKSVGQIDLSCGFFCHLFSEFN